MTMGLMSPLLQMMMSESQTNATNSKTVNSMGVGVSSEAQRRSSGNKFKAVRERLAKELATRKKAKKTKGKRGSIADIVDLPNPVQLPAPVPDEDLGLSTTVG